MNADVLSMLVTFHYQLFITHSLSTVQKSVKFNLKSSLLRNVGALKGNMWSFVLKKHINCGNL